MQNFFEEDFGNSEDFLVDMLPEEEESYFNQVTDCEDLIHSTDVYNPDFTDIYDADFEAIKAETKEALELDEELDRLGETTKRVIDGISYITKKTVEQKKENIFNKNTVRVRKYTNKAHFEKIIFAPPKVEKNSSKGLLIFFLILAFACGVYLGILANSYHNYNPETTAISCVIYGLLADDLGQGDVSFTLLPFDVDLFLKVFFWVFVIVALIGILAWTESDQKRQSRVGHEHGAARLATLKDFKSFQKKFME